MENNNEKSIQRLIMEISRMYMEKCFGKLKSLGIHPRQMPILAVLWKEDGCSQKELASQLGVKPPTVTVSIQRLEKIGIIVRKQDEKDQRISRIYLTEEGKAIINEGMRMAKEGEKQVLNGFSESELCLMKRFCIQIKENIAAMPAAIVSSVSGVKVFRGIGKPKQSAFTQRCAVTRKRRSVMRRTGSAGCASTGSSASKTSGRLAASRS